MNEKFLYEKIAYFLVIANSILFVEANVFGFMKSNPHLQPTTPQVIKRHGYPAETHTVQTADGFLLKLHRIPYGKSAKSKTHRYPLLLCHEFLDSSYEWILNGPNKSLAYKLPDEGYDVWLMNFRGNVYSIGHIGLTQIQYKYWDFSFHEMGIYDIPASIDYILNITQHQQLVMIGHSMGNTAFYITTSMIPKYNEKIKAQISLAPIANISHSTSSFRLLNLFRALFIIVIRTFFSGAVVPRNRYLNFLTNLLCNRLFPNFCYIFILEPMVGIDPYHFDVNLVPPFFAHWPAGTSLKTVLHFDQLTVPGNFRQFNYGILGNILKYGALIPPEYQLSNIEVPVRAYYGSTDALADPIDTQILYRQIPKPMGLIKVDSVTFNHGGFIGAFDVNSLLNDDVIRFINNVTDVTRGSTFVKNTVRRAIQERTKTL